MNIEGIFHVLSYLLLLLNNFDLLVLAVKLRGRHLNATY